MTLCVRNQGPSFLSGPSLPFFSPTPASPTLILVEVRLIVIYYGVINSRIMRKEGSGTFGEYSKGYTFVVFICTLGRNFKKTGERMQVSQQGKY